MKIGVLNLFGVWGFGFRVLPKLKMVELTLYYSPTCPYCRKVLNFMQQQNIKIPVKNRDESSANRQELIRIGGKAQVPCLIIDGKALYESDDIIDWMKKNLS